MEAAQPQIHCPYGWALPPAVICTVPTHLFLAPSTLSPRPRTPSAIPQKLYPQGWAQTPQPAGLAPSLTGGGLTRALMHGGQGATLFPVPPTMVWNVKAASQLGEC